MRDHATSPLSFFDISVVNQLTYSPRRAKVSTCVDALPKVSKFWVGVNLKNIVTHLFKKISTYDINHVYLIISMIEEADIGSKEVMIGLPDWQCICPERNLALHILTKTLRLEVIWECLVLEALQAGKVLKTVGESLVSQSSHSVKK